MENLLHLALSNACAAVVLALVAAAASFLLRRRPALVHGLWLLVLLKLFTPPLVRLPAPWTVAVSPAAAAEGAAAAPTVEVPARDEDQEPRFVLLRFDGEHPPTAAEVAPPEFIGPRPEVAIVPQEAQEERPALAAIVPPHAPAAAAPVPTTDWFVVAGVVWAAGSLAWFLLAAVRLRHFRRLLRFATVAPAELRERAARLARRLGLARCPAVLLVPGRVAPMLFAAGGAPRLLVPAALLGQVRDDQLDTLLLHELAHLRRRDHWVRGLELLAMGLYWWMPVVWWARRELREAEEQCCDAWVVSVLSGSRRAYAEALVETLDFLSDASPATPLLASGIGHVSDLKRRLTMIMNGTTPRALTWRGALTVLGLAALLPLLPAWVRAQPPAAEKKAIELRFEGLQIEVGDKAKAAANPATQQARAEAQKLEAELALRQAELKMFEQKLKAAQDRAKLAETPRVVNPAVPGANRVWRLTRGEGNVLLLQDNPFAPGAIPAHKGTLYELVPGEKGTLILRPVPMAQMAPPRGDSVREHLRLLLETTPPPPPVPPVRAVPQNPAPPKVPGWSTRPEAEGRAQDLEKRLDAIMKELEQLRKEIKTPRLGIVIDPARPPLGLEVKPAPKLEKQDEEARKLKEQRDHLEKVLQDLRKAVEDQKAREQGPRKP